MVRPTITSRKPRVALVGYGMAGRLFHGRLIALASGLELYGIVSRDPAARTQVIADHPRCRAMPSFDQAIADPAVDVVVLATPHDTHAPLAIAALSAGKHVVSDKVMCLNLPECDAMIAAANRADRLLTVFHNRRLDSDFLTLRQIIDTGQLGEPGEVRWIEMSWQKPSAFKQWKGQRSRGGGRLLDLGSHLIDQVLQIFPSPVQSVYCRMHTDIPEIEVETHAMVTIGFSDGCTAVVDVGCMARGNPKPRVMAVGRTGTLIKNGIDPQEAALVAGDIDAAKEDESTFGRIHTADGNTTVVPTVPGRWRSFYENLADVLAGRAQPLVKLDQMRRLVAVLDAAFESAQTGHVARPAVD
jgi:scyllo-inositol 2-dehydrogenase (NADP+)